MIIVVSDTHLSYNVAGEEKSNSDDFHTFLQSDLCQGLGKDDHLVLLGDIFEFWRRGNVSAVLDSKKILNELNHISDNNQVSIHYVVGNHDYSILGLHEKTTKYPFEVTRDWRYRSKNGTNYYFVHGYQLDVYANYEPFMTLEDYENWCQSLCERSDDVVGGVMSTLYSIPKFFTNIWKKFEEKEKSKKLEKENVKLLKEIEKKMDEITKSPSGKERKPKMGKLRTLAVSPHARSIFLGMKSDEFLIFGHTHKPFLDKDNRVANTGSWLGKKKNSNTFIKIDDTGTHLRQWNDQKDVPYTET